MILINAQLIVSRGQDEQMKLLVLIGSASLFTLTSCSISKSDIAAAGLVKFFRQCNDKPVDIQTYGQLLLAWRFDAERGEFNRLTLSSDPEYDFITALYENVPFTNEKLYENVSQLDISLKVHHFYALCKICDPSTPSFQGPNRLINSLYDHEKTELLGTVINYCWDKPPVLKYARALVKKFKPENLLKTIAAGSPEKLGALFHLSVQLSIGNLKTILEFCKCSTLQDDIKKKIIMPLIDDIIFDDDSDTKLLPIFETAAKNWSDEKFGASLGNYTGYLPNCPATILLFLRYGFHLVCARKGDYIHGLQAALEAFKMFQLAERLSVLSILPSEIRILLCQIIAFHAAPALLTLTVTPKNYAVQIQIQDFDTSGELLLLVCRRCNMLPSSKALYCDGTWLGNDILIKDIPREGNLHFQTVYRLIKSSEGCSGMNSKLI